MPLLLWCLGTWLSGGLVVLGGWSDLMILKVSSSNLHDSMIINTGCTRISLKLAFVVWEYLCYIIG